MAAYPKLVESRRCSCTFCLVYSEPPSQAVKAQSQVYVYVCALTSTGKIKYNNLM